MKEHPILFSAWSIRAVLAGRKTNTRRMSEVWMKVKAGDMLWVRENYQLETILEDLPAGLLVGSKDPVRYCADEFVRGVPIDYFGRIRASRFMPRWASRITLEATEDARREPLADISEEDAIAEGCAKIDISDIPIPAVDAAGYIHYADAKEHWDAARNRGLKSFRYMDRQGRRCTVFGPKAEFFALWDSLHAKDAPVLSNPSPVRLAFRVAHA